MVSGIFSAIFGSLAQEKRMEIITNNLANINTIGFKGDRPIFTISSIETSAGQADKTLIQPLYLTLAGIKTNFSPGGLKSTGNPLDLAIAGKGFFSIETPRGLRYTRKGNFAINSEGYLVTQEGFQVLGKGGPIRLDGKEVTVGPDGSITVDGRMVDSLKIVDFPTPYPLKKEGNSLFVPNSPLVQGIEPEEVEIKQGFLELSNVNPVEEMTAMIDVLRAYESYQKIIQSLSDVTSKLINEVGKI